MNQQQIVSELKQVNEVLKSIAGSLSEVIEGHSAGNAFMLSELRNETCEWFVVVTVDNSVVPIRLKNGNLETLVELLNYEFKKGHDLTEIKYIIFRRPHYKWYHALKLEEFLESINMLNEEYRAKMKEIPAANIFVSNYL